MSRAASRTLQLTSHLTPPLRRSLSISAEPRVAVIRQKQPTDATIARITISNPYKLNVLSTPLLNEFIATCRELQRDDCLRAVVLEGGQTPEGKASAFIGGADIKEMHQLSSPDEAKAFITRIHHACKALRDLPVPVIASVHGYCLGAGLEIAAACDLRIATKASVFGMPEVRVGIPSVVEAALLPGLIGMGRTRRLLYLAENIDAATAESWGLVEKLVDDEEELDDACSDWAGKIAEMGPLAIRNQKKLMQSWEDSTVTEGIEAGLVAFGRAFGDGGKEPRELMGKFVHRR